MHFGAKFSAHFSIEINWSKCDACTGSLCKLSSATVASRRKRNNKRDRSRPWCDWNA
jgi:hypothetical protein